MGYKLGLDGKAYASATTHEAGSITWTELDLVESIEQSNAKGQANVNNRSSKYEKSSGGQKRITYTLTLTKDTANAQFTLLQNAYDNDTVIALAIMDGDITTSGNKGFYMDVEVFDAPEPEELEEFNSVSFVLRPSAKSTYEPQRVTIA